MSIILWCLFDDIIIARPIYLFACAFCWLLYMHVVFILLDRNCQTSLFCHKVSIPIALFASIRTTVIHLSQGGPVAYICYINIIMMWLSCMHAVEKMSCQPEISHPVRGQPSKEEELYEHIEMQEEQSHYMTTIYPNHIDNNSQPWPAGQISTKIKRGKCVVIAIRNQCRTWAQYRTAIVKIWTVFVQSTSMRAVSRRPGLVRR